MIRWRPRRSFWAKPPYRLRRTVLDWQLHQYEWFPKSRTDMNPLRSVTHWHPDLRRKRLQKSVPGVWMLQARLEKWRRK